ncbi:MAG: DUF4197 domain-containing protein [Maricaulaceae bacterium]
MTELQQRRKILTGLGALGLGSLSLGGCASIDTAALGDILNSGLLSESDAAKGIRAALSNGVGQAISTVSRDGGFLNDALIHIPLPAALKDVKTALSVIGAQGLMSDLEVKLNRGAEAAAPIAKDIFLDAVTGLSIADAVGIVRGADNAATTYLKDRTTPRLTALFNPIMENALSQTGALQIFDQMSSQLTSVPFAPQLGADARQSLMDHGVKYALGGVFHYIAEEERQIREDPSKRTSDILRRVFGHN